MYFGSQTLFIFFFILPNVLYMHSYPLIYSDVNCFDKCTEVSNKYSLTAIHCFTINVFKTRKVKVGTWMKRGIPEITININNIKTLTCTCITETFSKLVQR